MIKWCLLSKLKTLDFTDFCPIFWYNDCKDFDKKKIVFLAVFLQILSIKGLKQCTNRSTSYSIHSSISTNLWDST